MKLIPFILFLSACTTVKNLPIKHYDIFSFDESQKLENYPVNKNLVVTYKTCSSNKTDRKEAVAPLIEGFYKKFNAKLLGLANGTAKPKKIMDSSLFVKNEICVTLQGSPITSESMSGQDSGEFNLEDKRQHTH